MNLEIGAVTETVNVIAGGVENLVNTQDASLGNNFVSQQILQLPLNARNVGNLLSLQPGVTPDGYVAGGRSDQANLTLDGVDVNEQQLGTAFTPVLRVSPDTVEEFRVITTNADANYGRSSGAQVSFITKSGSERFSRHAVRYHRNTITRRTISLTTAPDTSRQRTQRAFRRRSSWPTEVANSQVTPECFWRLA